MAHTTRPSLLVRLRDPRDSEAWREFEQQYRDLLRRYCLRGGLQAADAEDLCQVVLLALMRSLPGFQLDPTRGRFRHYLGRIVTNAIKQSRARKAGAPLDLESAALEALTVDPRQPIEASWEEEWSRHHLRRAMQTIRSQVQPGTLAAFERLLAGESVQQVAASLGMTVEGVHKIKQRIGERLREEVDRQIREEELPPLGPA